MLILFTGANGMVGRNLLAHPKAQSANILTPSSRELDLRNPAATAAYLEQYRPDAIVHMAAVVGGIQANIDEPVRFLADNAEMALSLFSAARRLGVRKIMNVASSCMYPRNVDGVLTTDSFKQILVPEDGMGDPAINIFKNAQVRFKLTPEGAEGVLAGFLDVEQWYYAMNTAWATHHAAYGQASAASIYKALRRAADGFPDPKTGENTAISGAMDLKLVQVYVIHDDKPAQVSSR